jgi:hypothetical protein
MYTLGNAHKNSNKAVGTIVGAAFFLMILFTGYMFYMLSNQVTNAQQQSIIQMNDFDLEHSQENVTCSAPFWSPGSLELTIKNTGPKLVNIIAVGFYDDGILPPDSKWSYELIQNKDLTDSTILTVYDVATANWVPSNTVRAYELAQLSPWETFKIRLTTAGIVQYPPSPYLIQILTDRGTIKVVGYP